MEKTCKWCNETINFIKPKSFGAHLTNCKMNPNKIERDLKSVKRKDFNLICSCGVEYIVNVTDHNLSTGRYNKFCSRKCANARVHSGLTKNKISESLLNTNSFKEKKIHIKKCENCYIEFITKYKKQFLCSMSCVRERNSKLGFCREGGLKGGLKSVQSQNRRSKNEILFSEYCDGKFDKILLNEPMFNGWDADIIIEDIKVAVLWNGKWHYEKITKKHSVKQVQNRDKIKIKEIINSGYIPYIIKDMGKYNIEKVKTEWEIFNIWLENKKVVVI